MLWFVLELGFAGFCSYLIEFGNFGILCWMFVVFLVWVVYIVAVGNGFGRGASLGFLFGRFDLVLWYLFSFSWWFLLGGWMVWCL